MRTTCLHCEENTIQREGDAFCIACEGSHFICNDCQNTFHDDMLSDCQEEAICLNCNPRPNSKHFICED